MSNAKRNIFVTTALPYANGAFHFGHILEYIQADIWVRHERMCGNNVHFVCADDAHGAPIMIAASKQGVTPQEFVAKISAGRQQYLDNFYINFDHWHCTESPENTELSQDIYRRQKDAGLIYTTDIEQFYDEEVGMFLADRFIKGTCPKCGAPDQYGDSCEKCSSVYSPTDLINPYSAISGSVPVLKTSTHYFFRLSDPRAQAFLKDWTMGNGAAGKPRVQAEVLAKDNEWLAGNLAAWDISRDATYFGIEIPDAPGKYFYVWLDAPIGYLASFKAYCAKKGLEIVQELSRPATDQIHFIGKDNIVFHCIVFPSMLRAHGGYILHENDQANEFLNLEGDKISTSRNWAVWLHEYLEEFPGKEDVLRYVLCANAPETKDNDFTWKDFQARNNNELVAVLGNFVNRALVLTRKYCGGRVPACGELTGYDRQTIAEVAAVKGSLEGNIENYRFREALKDAMNIARIGNKYLADTEPWKVIKTDPGRVKTILNIALQITANTAIAIEPFMPFSASKILKMLAVEKFGWERLGAMDLIAAGHKIGEASLLFEKIEDDVIQRQLDKLAATKEANLAAENSQNIEPQKDTIQFDDFQKMDIRVSTILAAEKVAKTKKLLKLTVDTGIDQRTIVSGIAEYFTPEELVGRRVLALVNLAPRELKGIVSQGMSLMAEDASGNLLLLGPDGNTNNGAIVG